MAAYGYWAIFSQFAPYDDEGTLLVDLWHFVHGAVLYRDIFSQYGPFYYEVFGALFAITGKTITTDTSRLIVLAVWEGSALTTGYVVHRLTGRTSLGLAATAVAFVALRELVNEPMHPIGLSALLLAMICLTVVLALRRTHLSSIVLGAELAGLVLTKVNLGVFALAALALACVTTIPELRAKSWLRLLVGLGFSLIALVVMRSDLNESWVRDLVFLSTCTTAAVVFAANVHTRRDAACPNPRWVLECAASLLGFTVLFLIVILLTGPSISDVYQGMITEAARGPKIFQIPQTLPAQSAIWGVAAFAAALAVMRLHIHVSSPGFAVAGALTRLASGLIMLFSVGSFSPFSVNPPAAGFVLPSVLAWLAVLPPTETGATGASSFIRTFLPALAVAETLQVYPVAGSQTGLAGVFFVPVAAILIHDGVRTLIGRYGRHADITNTVDIALWAVTAAAVWSLIVSPAISAGQSYASMPSLDIPGATRMHIEPAQVSAFRQITQLLRTDCTAFVGYPSLNSFYIWTGIRPPTETLPGGWMTLVENWRQERVVRELQKTTRPCVIRNDTLAQDWISGEPGLKSPPDGPLVQYVNSFHAVANFDGYELELPHSQK